LLPSKAYSISVRFELDVGRLFYDRNLLVEITQNTTSPNGAGLQKVNTFLVRHAIRPLFGSPPELNGNPAQVNSGTGSIAPNDRQHHDADAPPRPLVEGRRLVAVYDLLGFRAFIERSSLQEASAMIHKIHRWATLPNELPAGMPSETAFPDVSPARPLAHVVFLSDTIVAVAVGNEPTDELKLLYFVWRSMQMLLAVGFPVRGAVVRDEIYIASDMHTLAGRALVRAYDTQNKHCWSGITVDSAVIASGGDVFGRVREGRGLFSTLIVPYDVPLKHGGQEPSFAVNWRFNLVVKSGTRSLFPPTTDFEASRKVENTLQFAREMRNRGLLHANEDKLPCEFRAYFIGNTEPPFDHGDEF
jgi:hypothetical protein